MLYSIFLLLIYFICSVFLNPIVLICPFLPSLSPLVTSSLFSTFMSLFLFCIYICSYISRKSEDANLKRYMQPSVHSSTIYYSLFKGTIQVSINGRMDKDVVCIYTHTHIYAHHIFFIHCVYIYIHTYIHL